MANTIPGLNIRGAVVAPSSPSYEKAISRASETSVRRPAYVIYPQSPADVSEIVRFARSNDPPFDIAVKGGGTNFIPGLSSCDGGIVIDLAHLNHVKVSEDKQSVAVGGGALWGDVYAEVEKHGIAVVGGSVWNVGVGGLIVGGGYSILSGRYGLAIDNLLEATIVLADGQIATCSASQEPDLFWALRGAGNQFGVVTEFVLKAHPAPSPALVGALSYPGIELPGVLKALRTYLSAQTPDTRITLLFSRMPPDFRPAIVILPYVEGTPEKAKRTLSPFHTVVQPIFQRTTVAPSLNVVSHMSDAALADLPPRSVSGTVLFRELWDDVVISVFNEWLTFTEIEERRASIILWEFDFPMKIAAIRSDATAFPTRDPHYYAVVISRHSSPTADAYAQKWVSSITSHVKKSNVERTGINFPAPALLSPQGQDINDVYGEGYARLRALKAKYDPYKVWNKGYIIEPASD